MCRVSKSLYGLCTEKLYKRVNLLHNRRTNATRTYRRQRMFLNTIKQHPEYSKLVHTLKWTFTNLPCEDGYSTEQHVIWDVLSMLTNVSEISVMQYGIPMSTSCVDVPTGLTLFPTVKSITICGSLIDAIVQVLLPISKVSQLQRLRLGKLHMFRDVGMTTETTGPFLANMVGQCTNLQSMTVIDDEDDLRYPCRALGTTCTIYASFIDSTRGTLKYLFYRCRRPYMSNLQVANQIQQVLDHGSWPCLIEAKVHPKSDKAKSST